MTWIDLEPSKRTDNGEDLALRLVPGWQEHTGRLKIGLTRKFLETLGDGPRLRVGDIMAGSGTTSLACRDLEHACLVQDLCPDWTSHLHKLSELYSHMTVVTVPEQVDFLFLSPPFPKSHDQGNSEMQKSIRERSVWAGNDVFNQKAWRTQERFVKSLFWALLPWVQEQIPGTFVGVHCKNHIEKGEEIHVWEWVEEALFNLRMGVHEVGYRSRQTYLHLFREMKRFPLRDIVERKKGRERFSCGHSRERMKHTPESGHCRECPEIPLPDVGWDLMVVGEVLSHTNHTRGKTPEGHSS